MSYAASAGVLNNHQKFRSFFRTVPSFANLPPSIATIMDQFDWTQMLVFTQEETLFVDVSCFRRVLLINSIGISSL